MGWQTRYANPNDLYAGEGVNIAGTSQFRDPYLDVRFRRENAKYANSGTEVNTLQELQDIFDETIKEGLAKQFSDLTSQLQNLVGKTNDTVAEGIVKNSALMLVKLFNHTADQLATVKQQQLESLQDDSVKSANDLLKGIANLNEQIKKANIAGNPALELQDSRNSMIDELSGIVNLEVSTKKDDIGSGVYVEELSIQLVGANEKFNLVDNNNYKQFDLAKNTTTQDVETPIKILLKDQNGLPVGGSNNGVLSLVDGDITNQITTGEFSAHLKMLNSSGEFDDPATQDRGIQYYEKMLNTMVYEFANTLNAANSTSNPVPKLDALGNPVIGSDGRPVLQYDKPMFESIDGDTINASNIRIAQKWNNTSGSYLTATKTDANGVTTDNILSMIAKLSSDVNFTAPVTGTPLFKGNFQTCFTNISVTLGLELKSATRQTESYAGVLTDIDEQRASVSSVNIDEEGINLIQFNQSLSAASRYMTTLDEAVDTIINRMGLVGR